MSKSTITHMLMGLLAITLVVLLVGASCAPKPAPAAVSTPATKPRAPAEIVIYGATAGGSIYVLSVGIADLINKNSTWIKASVEETFGSNDDIMKGANDPLSRKAALRVVSSPAYYDALEGNKPFDRKYTDLKAVLFLSNAPCFFISVNPAIVSKEGLIGKRVVVGKELSAVRQFSEFIIRDCWGMWDKIKPQPLGWKEGGTALLDGLADAMQAITNVGAPGQFNMNPSFQEVFSTRDTYFFGPTEEEVARGNKVANRNYGYMYVPAGVFGPRQKMGFGGYTVLTQYFVYPEFPDDVLTEILRIVYENTDRLPSYHEMGRGVIKERLGWLDPAASMNDVHPAAIKLFKERNIPIVLAGGTDPAVKSK